ncbi:MAG: Phospholipase D1 [Vezdaea aestivalis]|nr:MAG: Phospholipase D1 [Vezdaea aestivalis]
MSKIAGSGSQPLSLPRPPSPSADRENEQPARDRLGGFVNGKDISATPQIQQDGSLDSSATKPEANGREDASPTTFHRSPPTDEVNPEAEALSRKRRASEGTEGLVHSLDGVGLQTPNKEKPTSGTVHGRRSVQFARSTTGDGSAAPAHSRQGSLSKASDLPAESPGRDKKAGSLLLKLKNLVPSSGHSLHHRSQSAFTVGSSSVAGDESPFSPISPSSERDNPRAGDVLHEESSDADAEESGGEHVNSGGRTRRKSSRRRVFNGVQTEPSTPKAPGRNLTNSFINHSEGNTPTSETSRPFKMRRRATMTDMNDQERERVGMSEGEGRDDLANNKPSPWKRGSNWMQYARGQSYTLSPRPTTAQNLKSDGKRPNPLRRLTGFGAHDQTGDGPLTPKRKTDRPSTVSAAKWRAVKAGLRLMGKKKKEDKIDQLRSSELLAELHAGAPAALILASMFQRDEHGNRRVPILLEQVKVKVTDSQSKSGTERHQMFRVELEYGSGLTRMKWVINRSAGDFANLHLRYKLNTRNTREAVKKARGSARSDPKRSLPHFPTGTFAFLRGSRGLDSDEEDEDDDDNDTALSGAESGPNANIRKRHKRRPSHGFTRRFSSAVHQSGEPIHSSAGINQSLTNLPATKRETYPERQRRKLEKYLQEMILHLAFRAESTRLCRFLELSALGVQLAAEGSYHGKEGPLVIESSKGIDQRVGWKSKLPSAQREKFKWFLIRHSYLVCVNSPEQMRIYDVLLVDEEFKVEDTPQQRKRDAMKDKDAKQLAKRAARTAKHPQHPSLKVCNTERKLKLLAKNDKQLDQFERSIQFMVSQTPWAEKNRYGSFAPVRHKVFAQWLVDGRDHMWNVSRAISMARDVIYIHDWWLSPELYMRRPPAISQKWRLDRLLQRKAQEGVKVFVIVYRNIDSAIPIDSQYSKSSLLDLHKNVFVQRSPNQARQGAFFWAHHEKICIVDHTVAFVGGIDLCFGRWDTPQHSVTDDKLTGYEASEAPKDADHCQLWPGKDYSNPRIQDFYSLDKPYEEMYDRTKVARMPWHDISMQIVGQPARDLTRHFVQRWNFILRQRTPTRPTPFLLPPADFNPADLETLGLDGTCEIQILRSCGQWSIGYLSKSRVEHSIMTAYAKLIEESEHFVYMENQFFITSCEVMGTKVENIIGDALVERIIRAYRNDEEWRAVILIPLVPGFQNTVDEQDGTSVRLIMQCQFYSICRGETSIFAKLRAHGIEPEDYIQFFSLRSWGRIGSTKTYVTEQLYIHAKCMIVDDRVAIIGSANVNERSMLGSRDSETAAVVRDTDMIWSTMGGEPYQVGRFAHTLRKRLMREHLGLNVDEISETERAEKFMADEEPGETINDVPQEYESDGKHHSSIDKLASTRKAQDKIVDSRREMQDRLVSDFNQAQTISFNVGSAEASSTNAHIEPGMNLKIDSKPDQSSAASPFYAKEADPSSPDNPQTLAEPAVLPPELNRMTTEQLGLPQLSQLPPLPVSDDIDIGGPPPNRSVSKGSKTGRGRFDDLKLPEVGQDCVQDPLNDSFYLDIWQTVAENNTKIFRNVFRCMPDNEVKTWKEYQEYVSYGDEFAAAQGAKHRKPEVHRARGSTSGPPGQGSFNEKINTLDLKGELNQEAERKVEVVGGKIIDKLPGPRTRQASDEPQTSQKDGQSRLASGIEIEKEHVPGQEDGLTEFPSLDVNEITIAPQETENPGVAAADSTSKQGASQRRKRRGTTRGSRREFYASDGLMEWPDVADSLDMVQGHLVVWSYNWLEKEDRGGNWLYNIDQLAPLEI